MAAQWKVEKQHDGTWYAEVNSDTTGIANEDFFKTEAEALRWCCDVLTGNVAEDVSWRELADEWFGKIEREIEETETSTGKLQTLVTDAREALEL